MGKKYYCDYCDKSFSDNPTSRKNHARGVHHRQARTAHYEHFKDAETQLREDTIKRPCRTFLNTGHCPFSISCRFSHMTDERRAQLRDEVRQQQESRKRQATTTATGDDVTDNQTPSSATSQSVVNQWLSKRLKLAPNSNMLATSADCVVDDTMSDAAAAVAETVPLPEIPESFRNIPSLPPSLLPWSPASVEMTSRDGSFRPAVWGS